MNRARAYLAKWEPCIDGDGGSPRAYKIACKMVHGFHLTQEEAFQIIWDDYNPRCLGPWTEKEWRHTIKNAAEKATSEDLTTQEAPQKPPPEAPRRISEPKAGPVIFTATTLLAKNLPEMKWAVNGLLPEGAIILGGRPYGQNTRTKAIRMPHVYFRVP
jgi:hypothetical protein